MESQDVENNLHPVKEERWPGDRDSSPSLILSIPGIERKLDLDDDPNDMDYSQSANPLTLAAAERPAKEGYGSEVKLYSYDRWPPTPAKAKLEGEGVESKVKLEDRAVPKNEDVQNSSASILKSERESGLYLKMFESNTDTDASMNLTNASRDLDSSKISPNNREACTSSDRSCIIAHESRLLTKNLILKESTYIIIITDDPCIFQRPAKRARMAFDGVHVPPLSAAHKRKVVENEREYYRRRLKLEEDKTKLQSSKNLNPGFQKDQDPTMNSYSVMHRLKKIGLEVVDQYFTLDKTTRSAMVTRAYMWQKWGGSMQATRPTIGPEFLALHGLNDFMYMNTDYQPYTPGVPGAPGAYLSFKPAHEEIGIVRLLAKSPENIPRAERGPPPWFYAGQYKVVPADAPVLSFQEWGDQTPKFRYNWTNEIVQQTWGTDIRVRIRARKEIGREPTPSECAEVKASKRYKDTTSEEVNAAYSSGQEQMGIWTMKCVGYDNEFQLRLSQDFPIWEDQQETESESRHGSDIPLGPHGRKRKRAATTESEFEPESEDSEEDDDFNAVMTDVSDSERKNESGSDNEEEDERFFDDEEEYGPIYDDNDEI